MSDEEEDSVSEGFSASEDEWKPSKDIRGGESSDDDDSDFEDAPTNLGNTSASGGGSSNRKRESETKKPGGGVQQASTGAKKRKPMGQSLRSKLYYKYRPPPKTFPSPNSGGNNSPSASTSRTASKNGRAPNESNKNRGDSNEGDDAANASSSESSVEDYLVNPAELDLQSSFFDVQTNKAAAMTAGTAGGQSPAPIFDCNAGIGNLSDSGSEDNNESSADERNISKAFDFRNLLEKANSLERAKDAIAKRTADAKAKATNKNQSGAAIDDVNTLLALGECKQNNTCAAADHTKMLHDAESQERVPQRLSKTKSTRVKRHTKTRPSSTVGAGGGAGNGDTDDSDWEEVADEEHSAHDAGAQLQANSSHAGSLEIHVELPSKHRKREQKKQQDVELMLKRKLNREMKETQLLLHKASLLCHFGRGFYYNRLLNDTQLLQAALKLLPSQNSYPPEQGTSLKYYQSLVTWFKTAIELKSHTLYPDKANKLKKRQVKVNLMSQIKQKQASCKQNMIFIFVILVRGMGLQCRLVLNMQPLPLRPAQTDLLTIKMNKEDADEGKKGGAEATAKHSKSSKDKAGEGSKAKPKTEEKHKEHKGQHHNSSSALKKEAELRAKIGARNLQEHDERKQVTSLKSKLEKAFTAATETKGLHKEQKVKKNTSVAATKKETKIVNKKTHHEIEAENNIKTQEELVEHIKNGEMGVEHRRCNSKQSEMQKLEGRASEEIELKPTHTTQDSSDEATALLVSQSMPSKERCAHLANSSVKSVQQHHAMDVEEATLPAIKMKAKPALCKLKRTKVESATAEPKKKKLTTATLLKPEFTPVAKRTRKASTSVNRLGALAAEKSIMEVNKKTLPKIIVPCDGDTLNGANIAEIENEQPQPTATAKGRLQAEQRGACARTRSKSPQFHISTNFLKTEMYKAKFGMAELAADEAEKKQQLRAKSKSPNTKVKVSTEFLKSPQNQRVLRPRQKDEVDVSPRSEKATSADGVPQLDGADDSVGNQVGARPKGKTKPPQLKKLKSRSSKEDSDEDFEPSPPKKPKQAPALSKAKTKLQKDRRVLSSDDDEEGANNADETTKGTGKRSATAADIWVEVWSDVEDQWICVDLTKAKLNSVDAIRRAASSSFAYVFAFQNDLSIKDITARYCQHWTSTVRKGRVEKAWLDTAIARYLAHRTPRDLHEDVELRRIHEDKPMPTTISEYKDHPLYALERHLLKFQAIYPPNAPTLGFVRSEPVYSRDCVHTLHSRDIWLKQARTVKLGEQPYKIVKARPKWDRLTQTVIKDQPLEIFGYWQTEDYVPPTAENGLVPRNAYGNVELFKACMLPKKTVHLRLPGLNRICKKLSIDCASAVIGFDFHQGACHPLYDGFVVCEEFAETVTAAWHQDQDEQERKEQEKYEGRVYGNWKKLIRGLLIRERLKKKYNF